jgi:hypothetical protein
MKNFIGGLFKDQKGAELALKALKENGFTDESINMLECTHENKAVVVKNPSIQSIGIAAIIGAFLVGGLGAVLGILIGLGWLTIPSVESTGGAAIPVTGDFIFSSITSGLILGGVTGIILGVAAWLLMAKYRKVDTSHGIKPGDFMLAVQADDIRRETKARLTMKEYGAVKFEEFREKWDAEIWSAFDEDKVPEAS